MIEGQGDVEVLAYVNSNLILIHNDPKSAEKIPVSAPNSVSEMAPKTLLPKNLNINKSVTVINEAVISKSKVKSDSKSESKSNAKKVVKKVDDPIVANFSVEGWPVNKSRMATDYIDYQGQTAIISPKNTFASPFASKLFFSIWVRLENRVFPIFQNLACDAFSSFGLNYLNFPALL